MLVTVPMDPSAIPMGRRPASARKIGRDAAMNQEEHDAHLRSGMIVGVAAYLFWGLATLYWHELDHFDAFELIGYRILFSAVTVAIAITVTRRWRHLLPVAGRACSGASPSPPCCSR